MRVALIYNLKKDDKASELPVDYFSEFDSPKTIDAITRALEKGGNEVFPVEADRNIALWLKNNEVDIAFNIAEGSFGENRESYIPAILESLKIPHTGSGAVTLAVALDKHKTKQILKYEGIPTPDFQLFRSAKERLKKTLRFPLIVKPNKEGSAKGITLDSIVEDERDAYRQINSVLQRYKQDVLVEEFIHGKELTVGVLGTSDLAVLPILEIDFSQCMSSGEYFYSWRMKEFQGDMSRGLIPVFHCPARLCVDKALEIDEMVKKAHIVLGCRDISRTDIRLSKDGIPYVLEVNPLPGLDPEESNFTYIAKSAGIEYKDLINGILISSVSRYKKDKCVLKEGDEIRWEQMMAA